MTFPGLFLLLNNHVPGAMIPYAGPMIAAPRGGTNWSDIIDGVFPAGEQAAQWIYFRIRLR